ncbi:DUF3955 domain-containing protein [Bacillus cereus]|uniref:DUF3955 domain-containing protein n=1 Tax=Bacillus cereus TaxID=1396 RepID=UPI00211D5A8B|nr:DUF3955 domain-containing protein [Bacillus cereus]
MLSLITFIAGIGCLITYHVHVIGTAIAADRTPVEAFYLLPIGYSLITISIISLFASKKVKK